MLLLLLCVCVCDCRKQDLDSALISRFDLCIRYDLPDDATRKAVFARYVLARVLAMALEKIRC